jgi:SAM-dependent methyltransferase
MAAMGFDVAADAYDRYMGRFSTQLSSAMAALAGVRKGSSVLDVGCGPGALTAELVARVGPANVTAVDPSEPFVAAARGRHPGVTVVRAAAEALPFDDDSFDAALAQLVVHFMADPVSGLGEMRRVTRPGGTVVASVWDFGGDRAPISPFWAAARSVDPLLRDESHLAGVREGHLEALFAAAGLTDIRVTTLASSVAYGSFDEWWAPYTGGVGPGGVYVAGLDAAMLAEVREACRRSLPPGSFTLTAVAWACRGTVGPA